VREEAWDSCTEFTVAGFNIFWTSSEVFEAWDSCTKLTVARFNIFWTFSKLIEVGNGGALLGDGVARAGHRCC
jgi:hypothetical protein